MSAPRILIVGGSTRAAADSVRRAGWIPICADLFADLDLRSTAEVIRVSQYPASLPRDVAHVHADGWFYCGALENHPEILAQIPACNSSLGPLLGTSPDALRFVRDPIWLANTMRSAGLPSLDVAGQTSPPSSDGTWLQKPLATAGGRLIRVWDATALRCPFTEPHYFQRRAAGTGLSALVRVENGQINWLGASRELPVGTAFRPSTEFTYCGSVGPLNLTYEVKVDSKAISRETFFQFEWTDSQRSQWKHAVGATDGCGMEADLSAVQHQLMAITQLLVNRLPGLKGLIGLDFRFDNGTVWLTEVNPRYTASIEVLELATGRSFLNPNATPAEIPSSPAVHARPKLIVKQILYATHSMIAPDLSRFLPTADPWQMPIVADIPMPGIVVESGWPICTVLAAAESFAAASSILQHRISLVRSELEGESATVS